MYAAARRRRTDSAARCRRRYMISRLLLPLAAAMALGSSAARAADAAPFDLAGPTIDVTVTRGAMTLPIAQVPNLATGDRLWLKAVLPPTQSEHYLLVTAFLRGATNPPPAEWFLRCETWKGDCAGKGLTVPVPDGAQQVLVFLAPATGGDFKTLMNAVRGRPGAFVRASQDLVQAALDRSRLEVYLASIHTLDATDQARLKEAAPLLARSLAIKVEKNCLDRLPELQAPCLMQGQSALILNDGHSTSIVEALTSGPASDLAMEASYTPQLSYGYYSPYVASVLDIARIMESFHTAQYQYIPALATLDGEHMRLTVNSPPSFHNPKSVLVAALPAVEAPQPPPLHAVDPKEIFCARKNSLVLPVEGAPLVFATRYAHDMRLKLTGQNGKIIDLPARADAAQGGFVVDTGLGAGTGGLGAAELGDSLEGVLHGYWGFDEWDGPRFQLVNSRTQHWELASAGDGALIVGREDTVHLQAGEVSCIENVMLQSPAGKDLKTEWKAVKANQVEVTLPLQSAEPGTMTLLVNEYGASQPQPVSLQAFAQAGHLEDFTLHAGDREGLLRGTRLDQVASLAIQGMQFAPGKLISTPGGDELTMVLQDAAAAVVLKQHASVAGKVTLKDGRAFNLAVLIDAPRPSVKLIGRSVQRSAAGRDSNIQLADQDELPQDAKLTFSLQAQSPASFARDETIEVATTDEAFSTQLSLANGGLTLGDRLVAVASLDPAAAFGPSAFGPLQFRAVVGAAKGDWQPLATLVRLPALKSLDCPATAELACKLSGSNLFLLDSVADEPRFVHPVDIPDGFPGYSLPVPHPIDGTLYVKLRDDPAVVNAALLAAQPVPRTVEDGTRDAVRQAATVPAPAAPAAVPAAAAPPDTSSQRSEPPPAPAPAPAAPVP